MKRTIQFFGMATLLVASCTLDLQAIVELIDSNDLSDSVMGSLTINRSQTAMIAINNQAPARHLKTFDLNGNLIASAKFPPAVATAANWEDPSWFWTLDTSGRLIRWNTSLTKPKLVYRIPAGPPSMTRTYCDFDVTKSGVFYITTLETSFIGHGTEHVQGQLLRYDPANNVAPLTNTWDAGTAGIHNQNVPPGHPLFYLDRCPRVSVDPVKNVAYVLDHNDDINDLTRVVSYTDQLAVSGQYLLPQVLDALDIAVIGSELAITSHTPGHLPMAALYNWAAPNGPRFESQTPMWSGAGAFFTAPLLNGNPPGVHLWLDSPMNNDLLSVTKIPVVQ
jgi:hypothetical protein